MHALLARQLKRLGLSAEAPPGDAATWQALLARIGSYYAETDSGYALLERSVQLSSHEMKALNERIRQQGERDLAVERDKLAAVVEALSEGLLAIDDQLTIQLANRSAQELLELPVQELLGRGLFTLLACQEGCTVEAELTRALREGTRFTTDRCRFRRKDGTFPAAMTVDPIAGDRQNGAVVLFRDLTAQHAAEAARARREERERRTHAAVQELARSRAVHEGNVARALVEITESSAVAAEVARASVWWFDEGARALTCADLYRSDDGVHERGATLREHDHPVYFASLGQGAALAAHDARGDARTAELHEAHLAPFGVVARLDVPIIIGERLVGILCLEHVGEARTWTLEEQNVAQLCANCVALAYEASERACTQHELLASRTFLDSVIENIPAMVFVKRASDLSFVRLNRAGEALLGWSQESLIGKSDRDFFPGEQAEAFIARDREVLARGEVVDIACESIETRTQGTRLLHTRKIAIRDQAGEATHLLGISEDITEKHAAAEALALAKEAAEQASMAKSRFIANISHEIRTPMNAVLGLSELLLDSPLAPDDRARARSIHGATRALLRVINDVLDVSRIEASRFELVEGTFSPAEMLDQVVALLCPLADAKGLTLRLERQGELPGLARGDEGRIRQILINLVGNAIKFTERGEVELRVASGLRGEGQHELCVAVRDTGPGIPEDRLNELFRPFSQVDGSHTRAHGGTGLGLYIARELARRMGGDITVASRVGEGSLFRVVVPLSVEAPAKASGPPALSIPPATRPLAILVAEDNPLNQEIVRAMLEQAGHRVVLAEDGEVALTRFVGEPFDCVLMDCQMPRLDGLEATRRLRSYEQRAGRAATPVVALTASAMPEDKERFREAGMNGFLAKPYSRKELLAVLSEYASGRTAAE